jgi:hypothetical protein
MHDPRIPHYNHVKHILRYLKGTLDHRFHINPSTPTYLTVYSDASKIHVRILCFSWLQFDFMVFEMAGYSFSLVRWSRVPCGFPCCSSNDVVASVVIGSLQAIHSAIYMFRNPAQHRRTKHIEIDIHFVREKVAFWGKFEFFMFPLQLSLRTSSPRAYRLHHLLIFDTVSMLFHSTLMLGDDRLYCSRFIFLITPFRVSRPPHIYTL